jgi:AAA15 family ATPase/GTPase
MNLMSEQKLPLTSLAIGGYRSFGDVQRFEKLAQVNLFIGQNNCGKSNVLRFVHEVYSSSLEINKQFTLGSVDVSS